MRPPPSRWHHPVPTPPPAVMEAAALGTSWAKPTCTSVVSIQEPQTRTWSNYVNRECPLAILVSCGNEFRYGEGKYGQVHNQQLNRNSGCIIRPENALKKGCVGEKNSSVLIWPFMRRLEMHCWQIILKWMWIT